MQAEPHRFSRSAEDLIASLRRIPSEDPSRSRRRPAKELVELIDSLRAKHGIGQPTAEQAIRDVWPDLVGPLNASHSHPVRIDERGRLIVHVDHSVVRDELYFNRAEIVDRIRKMPACSSVKYLHMAQG